MLAFHTYSPPAPVRDATARKMTSTFVSLSLVLLVPVTLHSLTAAAPNSSDDDSEFNGQSPWFAALLLVMFLVTCFFLFGGGSGGRCLLEQILASFPSPSPLSPPPPPPPLLPLLPPQPPQHISATNPLLLASHSILPSALKFLSQSHKVLTAVAKDRGELSERIVNYIFSSPPAFIHLSVTEPSDPDLEATLSWEPPPPPSSLPPPPLPCFTVFATNSTPPSQNAQRMSSHITMHNLPPLPLVVETVHNVIEVFSSDSYSPLELCRHALPLLPSTLSFFSTIFSPSFPVFTKTPFSSPSSSPPSSSSVISAALPFNAPGLLSNYPEVLHVVQSIADLHAVVKTVEGSEVASARITGTSASSSLALATAVSGRHLALAGGGEPVLYSPLGGCSWLVQLDLSVYMSRWGWMSLRCPRTNVRIEQRGTAQNENGDLELKVSIESIENAGGILSKVLPHKKLSRFLQVSKQPEVILKNRSSLLFFLFLQCSLFSSFFFFSLFSSFFFRCRRTSLSPSF